MVMQRHAYRILTALIVLNLPLRRGSWSVFVVPMLLTGMNPK